MRSVVLDSLRGIAILLVLFRHYHFSFLMNMVGWIGVDLFFVLSGFLVSGLLFKEFQTRGSVDPKHFLIRRSFKIYPTFYVFLILTLGGYVVLKAVGHEHPLELYKLIYEALFIQNYFPAVWGHTWSLAVEEHFYILLAIIIFLLVKKDKLSNSSLIITGIVTVLILVLFMRAITWQFNPNFSFHTHMYATHLRIDSLLFGVFISYLFQFHHHVFNSLARTYWKPALIVSMLLLSAPFIWAINSIWMGTIGLTALYLGFGLILWLGVAFEAEIKSVRFFKFVFGWISFIGFYSYSIYVFHTMIAAFLMPLIEKLLPAFDVKILFLVYGILCITVGVVMSRLIEMPFLAIRDRYFPRLSNENTQNI
jgi:peptidoglycan/LPS O-acetylase OafA/YrhL